MKKRICQLLSLILVASLVSIPGASGSTGEGSLLAAVASSSVPTVAFSKDETVYASMNHDGTLARVSVVNRLETRSTGQYIDYGVYSEIKNLTNSLMPRIEENKVVWELPSSDEGFYYEGLLESAQLPFTFTIAYTLDGKTLNPQELLGKSGRLEINIQVKANDKAADYFKKHFMAQIQIPLSLDKCSNIKADGAQSVISGRTNTLAFMVLPGASQNFTLSMDARAFEMDSITASFIPMDIKSLMGLDLQGVASDTEDLSAGTEALVKGTQQLEDGIVRLVDGLKNTSSGMAQIIKGSKEFQSGLVAYVQGIGALSTNLAQLGQGMTQLGQKGPQLLDGYTQLSGGTQQMLDVLLASIPPEQQGFYQEQVAHLKKQLQEYGGSLNTYTQGVSQSAQGLAALEAGLDEAARQGAALVEGGGKIHNNLSKLGQGINALAEGANPLPEGIRQLVEGQKKLNAGIAEAINLIKEFNFIQEDSGESVSFVDPNQRVHSVQFIIRTPELRIQEEKASAIEAVKPKTFWEKLVDLFK